MKRLALWLIVGAAVVFLPLIASYVFEYFNPYINGTIKKGK